MYEEAEKWMRAVGRRKFMGGSAPNLADLVLLYYFTELNQTIVQHVCYSCTFEVLQSISLLLAFPLIEHPMIWKMI